MEIRRDTIVGFERAYFPEQLARIPGASRMVMLQALLKHLRRSQPTI